jgi:primosomal protein N' (replication factor Y)
VAIERAKIAGASVVLGSATPAVVTYYKALKGEYVLHKISGRANNQDMAQVYTVDLRQELAQGNRDIFSVKLLELVKDRLDKKQQIILFINRRGYAGFVSCRSCGKPVRCPHCDVSLTLHKRRNTDDRLVCHYCGYTIPSPKLCPNCSSKYIGRFGLGTEQVEERIKVLFPQAKTLRMDMDTTRGKGEYENILSAFAEGEADILVGTQMIVKGHDFPNVTLVGIIAADLSLFSSDYMASERTFQLLTQAAGRAGRGKLKGEVVVQTYNPDEMCIQTAVKQDYEEFYRNEIGYRMLMSYPPAYNMCAILISHKNEEKADRVAEDIAKRIEKSKIDGLTVMGPAKATISKINDIYRNVIYIKHIESDIIIKIENAALKYLNTVEDYSDVSVQFDYNPMSNY